MATQTQTVCSQTLPSHGDNDADDCLCSSEVTVSPSELEDAPLGRPNGYLTGEARIERAWAHWNKLGRPKLIVAPMVDNSELPFRMLCRKYGAQAAYTPMLHARIFSENDKYRSQEFTTCKEDRPLFVQFCANDPDVLLDAARRVEAHCDYVDINFGCPQAADSQTWQLRSLLNGQSPPRQIPSRETVQQPQHTNPRCSLLAVHGRTRDGKKVRADWAIIKSVKNAVRIPTIVWRRQRLRGFCQPSPFWRTLHFSPKLSFELLNGIVDRLRLEGVV